MYIPYVETTKEEEKTAKPIWWLALKIAIVILIVTLDWIGLASTKGTNSFFSDSEKSQQNSFEAGNLDFELDASTLTPSPIAVGETSVQIVKILNKGNLFKYKISSAELSSDLCDYVNIEAKIGGDTKYSGSLKDLDYGPKDFSDPEEWTFIASFQSGVPSNLRGETCQFKFVFFGSQVKNNLPFGQGFTDVEEVSNSLEISQPAIVINKVYYDVDALHGTEAKNEWVELYNPGSVPVSLKKWELCDNTDCERIDNEVSIPGLGYAVVAHDAETWKYWDIPEDVVKIHQLGGRFMALSNDADMVLLKDNLGNHIDQMNWGTPSTTWVNYNPSLWNPGVADVLEGHMLGRKPNGFDTDQVSDWHDFSLSKVEVIYPNGGEVWYVGRTYEILWDANNLNGPDLDLAIDIFYSRDSGRSWVKIAEKTENDGVYSWRVPLVIGDYSMVSDKARIKVVARGPENFMLWNWDMTDEDFCPPVDYSLLTEEEIKILEEMLEDGEISEEEIVNEDMEEISSESEEIIEVDAKTETSDEEDNEKEENKSPEKAADNISVVTDTQKEVVVEEKTVEKIETVKTDSEVKEPEKTESILPSESAPAN